MSIQAPVPTYTHRHHAFAKERTYRLTADALTWSEEGDWVVQRMPYADIASVRLAYRPSRAQTDRYMATIVSRKGGAVVLTNTSFQSFGSFVSDDATYSGFMRALHQHLADSGSTAHFRKGSSVLGYAVNMAISLGVLAALVIVGGYMLVHGVYGLVAVKLLVIAFFLPTLYRFMLRSRPGSYDPRDLPQAALPA